MALFKKGAGGGVEPDKVIKTLIAALLFLFVINSFINFSAISGDEKCLGLTTTGADCLDYETESTCIAQSGCVWEAPGIFKEDFKYDEMASGFYKFLIVGMAGWLAWTFTSKAGGKFDRRALITVIVAVVILYILWNNFIAPQLDLEPIEFAAYQLQAMFAP